MRATTGLARRATVGAVNPAEADQAGDCLLSVLCSLLQRPSGAQRRMKSCLLCSLWGQLRLGVLADRIRDEPQ